MKKLLIALVFLTTTAHAQITNSTRPGQSDPSVVIPNLSFQLETGYQLQMTNASNGGLQSSIIETTDNLFPLYFRFAFLERIELHALMTYQRSRTIDNSGWSGQLEFNNNGFNDLLYGISIWALKESKFLPNVSLVTHFNTPSGNRSFQGEWSGWYRISMSKGLTDNLSIGSNLGSTSTFESSEFWFSDYTAWVSYTVSPRMALFVEHFANSDPTYNWNFSIDGGLTYLINEDIQWDVHFGTGFNHTFNFISTGLCWNFHKDQPMQPL